MSMITRWMDEKLYPGYEDGWDNIRFRESILENLQGDHALLDYGAGRGAVAEMDFRGKAGMIVGVDLDDAVLTNPFLDEAKLIETPSGRIPCEAQTFDLVFSSNVMEHVGDPRVCFGEIYRVLKPGGVFLAKTPNKRHYVPTMARLTPHWFHVAYNRLRGQEAHDTFPTLYRCNTSRVVKRTARSIGFEVLGLEFWEGRPEYLRIAAPLYVVGYCFERTVNSSSLFEPIRCVLFFALRKPDDD